MHKIYIKIQYTHSRLFAQPSPTQLIITNIPLSLSPFPYPNIPYTIHTQTGRNLPPPSLPQIHSINQPQSHHFSHPLSQIPHSSLLTPLISPISHLPSPLSSFSFLLSHFHFPPFLHTILYILYKLSITYAPDRKCPFPNPLLPTPHFLLPSSHSSNPQIHHIPFLFSHLPTNHTQYTLIPKIPSTHSLYLSPNFPNPHSSPLPSLSLTYPLSHDPTIPKFSNQNQNQNQN